MENILEVSKWIQCLGCRSLNNYMYVDYWRAVHNIQHLPTPVSTELDAEGSSVMWQHFTTMTDVL